MKKAVIILALVILATIALLVFLFQEGESDSSIISFNRNSEKPDKNNSQDLSKQDNRENISDNINSQNKENSVTGGGSGGAESNVNENSKTNKSFPQDINEKECGFYYSEYKACAGICPEGSCVSEGRSCYCKK